MGPKSLTTNYIRQNWLYILMLDSGKPQMPVQAVCEFYPTDTVESVPLSREKYEIIKQYD